jgi:hypothetical protein
VVYKKKSFGPEVSVPVLDKRGNERQLSLWEHRGPKLPPFVFLFCEGMRLIYRAKLTGNEHDILTFFLTQVNYENRFEHDRPLCFAETGISRSNQYAALHTLQRAGLIFKAEKINRSQLYKFHPLLAWKGNSVLYYPTLHTFDTSSAVESKLALEEAARQTLEDYGFQKKQT